MPVRSLSLSTFARCRNVLLLRTPDLHIIMGDRLASLPCGLSAMLEADGLSTPTFRVAKQASLAGGELGTALRERIALQKECAQALIDLQDGVEQDGVTSTEKDRRALGELLLDAVCGHQCSKTKGVPFLVYTTDAFAGVGVAAYSPDIWPAVCPCGTPIRRSVAQTARLADVRPYGKTGRCILIQSMGVRRQPSRRL